MSPTFFKKLLVLFWALWWITAFLTDFIGGLNRLGVVHTPWFDGQNYVSLQQALDPFDVSAFVILFFYVGIIAWSFLSSCLFVLAVATPMRDRAVWQHRVDRAFIVSLGLWLAFFLADQVVMDFPLEQNHMVQGGFQLLCYLAIYLLPERE